MSALRTSPLEKCWIDHRKQPWLAKEFLHKLTSQIYFKIQIESSGYRTLACKSTEFLQSNININKVFEYSFRLFSGEITEILHLLFFPAVQTFLWLCSSNSNSISLFSSWIWSEYLAEITCNIEKSFPHYLK